jgi:hypothetical protein
MINFKQPHEILNQFKQYTNPYDFSNEKTTVNFDDAIKAMVEYAAQFEQLQQHSVMQGLPTDEELWERLQKLPYTNGLDDGQYNDGVIDGFEQGVRWVYQKLSGSPTVADGAAGKNG